MVDEKKEKRICKECNQQIKEGEEYIKEGGTYHHKKESQDKKGKSIICEFC